MRRLSYRFESHRRTKSLYTADDLGHEVAGTVEQVGAHCRDFKIGDRVIIGMRYKCGRCRYCLSARENLCERRPAPPSLKKHDGTG